MHAIYEVSITYGSKIIANRRTGQKNMPPIIRFLGIKTKLEILNVYLYVLTFLDALVQITFVRWQIIVLQKIFSY